MDGNKKDNIEISITIDGKTYENGMEFGHHRMSAAFLPALLPALFASAIEVLARGVALEERIDWADRLLQELDRKARQAVRAERVRAGFGPVDPLVPVTRVTVHPELTGDAVGFRVEPLGTGAAALHVSPTLEERALGLVFTPDTNRTVLLGVTVAEVTAALGGAS